MSECAPSLTCLAQVERGSLMGTCGPGIFDDDVAMDVKVMFENDLTHGYSIAAATQHVLQEPPWGFDDEEDTAVTWLALAALQVEHHALDQVVRKRALDIIDSGVPLWRWEGQSDEKVAERTAVLQSFRQQLSDNHPSPT
jgi:hypothetical protein